MYGKMSWKTKADGWLPVQDENLERAVRNTVNTPWEISAFTQGVIVPAWVIEAANKYQEVGGYAGLALFEWLDKMSSGREPEPKHPF
jgi:hypothetical protein